MVKQLEGKHLTVRDVVDVARDGRQIAISAAALARLNEGRRYFETRLSRGDVMYGVNTGIGELAEARVEREDALRFQENLVRSHAAGIGDPAPSDWVRGAMLCRINVHLHGRSGCRAAITETLVQMLNRGVTPVVALRGSVGACGDLAPMAQIALLMLGEGEAFFRGERLPGKVAMERAGIPLPGLHERDGLALINGSNVTCAASALQLHDMLSFIEQTEIVASMTLEAVGTSIGPLHALLHEVRGFSGSLASAAAMLSCIEGGDLHAGRVRSLVQDAYSLRAAPQIMGAARDALAYAQQQVEIELNGVGDNPILFPEYDLCLTGANFQGMPIGLPMDMMSAAITAVCVMSERRVNRMLNASLSNGLPSFLSARPGPMSGFMLSQYTAGALVAEQRILSAPASVQSIPAAADQEDFVSMSMTTAIKNRQIMDNAWGVLGIEALVAAQALDMRQRAYGRGVEAARGAIRETIPHLAEDRELHRDHDAAAQMLRAGRLLSRIDAT